MLCLDNQIVSEVASHDFILGRPYPPRKPGAMIRLEIANPDGKVSKLLTSTHKFINKQQIKLTLSRENGKEKLKECKSDILCVQSTFTIILLLVKGPQHQF